jgi:hypothetical protein
MVSLRRLGRGAMLMPTVRVQPSTIEVPPPTLKVSPTTIEVLPPTAGHQDVIADC